MKHKKVKAAAIVGALVGCMAIGGILAYFTDGDTATNTFTVGKISLDLQEPDWDPEDGEDLTPGKEIEKNPQIYNDGDNEAFVFMEVVVPYANVVTAKADGTKVEAADTELFSYDVNAGWTELTEYLTKDEENQTVTHLYAYTGEDSATMLALAVGETTPTVFDFVRFANIVEDQGLEGATLTLQINAYGIQTINVASVKTAVDGDNSTGTISPSAVWQVLSNQAPTTVVSEAEDATTDVKLEAEEE